MFLLRPPTVEQVDRFLASQREQPFSYPEVGASREQPPRGYIVDHNRVRLGSGDAIFQRAVAALRHWEMFKLGWMRLCWPDAPLAEGSVVAVLAGLPGALGLDLLWSLNACRVVYMLDQDGPLRRFGFAYGTLLDHAARGEERFLIEWDRNNNTVWYDILAFSRPQHPLALLGFPVARLLQKRFGRDSKAAMLRAVRS